MNMSILEHLKQDSHLCPGPGRHYPRYDIRPVGSESEPKFKARMGDQVEEI